MEKFYSSPRKNLEGTLETARFLLSVKEDFIKDYKSRCKNLSHAHGRRLRNENQLWRQLNEWCAEDGVTPISEKLVEFLVTMLNRYFLAYKDELFTEAEMLSLDGIYVNCACIEHDGYVCAKFVRSFEKVTKIYVGDITVNDSTPILMFVQYESQGEVYEYVDISWRILDSVGNIRPIIKGNFRALKLALLDGTIDIDKYEPTKRV